MALSALVKKLLFARQFEIDNGRVNMLGMRKVIISPDVISELCSTDSKTVYKAAKSALKKDTSHLKDDMGVTGKQLLDFSIQLLEAYGVGNLQLINIELKSKRAMFIVNDSVFAKKGGCGFTAGALAGVLSVMFDSDVDVKETMCASKADHCQFEVKP